MKTLIRISKTAPVTIRANGKTSSGAKEYTCQFWQPGVVSYEDCGEGVALLNKETMDKMLPSFVGKPVVIDHVEAQPEEIFNSGQAVGRVTEAVWNAETGWYDAKFTVEDPKAQELIESGYSVSCAFNVMDAGEGGEWHSIKYNEEVTDGSFTHLALVQNPRYEDSKIFKNSKRMFLNSKGAKAVVNAKGKFGTLDGETYKGEMYYPTGKKGTRISTGKKSEELGTEGGVKIVWRDEDGNTYENSKENAQKLGCPNCGADVSKEQGEEIVCPKCHTDFWKSEALRPEDIASGMKPMKELRKNDTAGDFGTLMREIKEQLYQIAQALGQKFSGKEIETAKQNAKHGQVIKGPVNGMSLIYSEANAGYLLMWHDQLVNIISDKAEALAEFDRITRENEKESTAKHNSYGNYMIASDLDKGVTPDEVVKRIMARYSDIKEPQAVAIVKAVMRGGANASTDWSHKENADRGQLQVGDSVKITGPVGSKGKRGTVVDMDTQGAFVVVDLGGEKASFHASDVTKANSKADESNDKKNNGILRVSKKNCSDTNAGKSKMFGWFKSKKNAVEDEAKKAAQDEAALKAQEAAKDMKENGEQVNLAEQMVEIDGQQVSLADLIKTYQAEQAEQAVMAENAVEEKVLSPEDPIADEAGNVYKVGDLLNAYQNKKARMNAEAEEKAKKDKEAADAEAKKNGQETPEEKAAREAKENESPEEKELRIKKENEKEAYLNGLDFGDGKTEAEARAKLKEMGYTDAEVEETIATKKAGASKTNSKGAKKDIKFFKKLNSLKDASTEIRENGLETLKDKIARGKQKYGSKKKK